MARSKALAGRSRVQPFWASWALRSCDRMIMLRRCDDREAASGRQCYHPAVQPQRASTLPHTRLPLMLAAVAPWHPAPQLRALATAARRLPPRAAPARQWRCTARAPAVAHAAVPRPGFAAFAPSRSFCRASGPAAGGFMPSQSSPGDEENLMDEVRLTNRSAPSVSRALTAASV